MGEAFELCEGDGRPPFLKMLLLTRPCCRSELSLALASGTAFLDGLRGSWSPSSAVVVAVEAADVVLLPLRWGDDDDDDDEEKSSWGGRLAVRTGDQPADEAPRMAAVLASGEASAPSS